MRSERSLSLLREQNDTTITVGDHDDIGMTANAGNKSEREAKKISKRNTERDREGNMGSDRDNVSRD